MLDSVGYVHVRYLLMFLSICSVIRVSRHTGKIRAIASDKPVNSFFKRYPGGLAEGFVSKRIDNSAKSRQ